MKITASSYAASGRVKTVFIPLFQKESPRRSPFFSSLPASLKDAVLKFARTQFRGEEGEIKSLWLATGGGRRVVLAGLGDKQRWNARKDLLLPRRMVRYAKAERIAEFAAPLALSPAAFATEAVMAHFDYALHKEAPPGGWPEVKNIVLAVAPEQKSAAQKAAAQGMILGEEANAARTLANTPGSDMTPAALAAEARRVGSRNPAIKVKILDESAIRKLGMGGVLGVARGSDEKPAFIILKYMRGARDQKPLALVGKGVTFDTGGINLKPGQYMSDMHMDMTGGAAVIHGIAAAARLKLPVNLVGLVPAVENMPSGSSYRPGDLLKTMSGKVIEVLDTDAEGRVILSDALAYALRYKPGLIVDFATLTGAAHVALGHYISALFTNRDALTGKLVAVGDASGDYVWPMPLWDEYLADIKGTFGDLANVGKTDRYGGAIHGAKFLEQFVGDTPWAHIDIAPRMTTVDADYLAKGASGVGVRYIAELAAAYPNISETLHS